MTSPAALFFLVGLLAQAPALAPAASASEAEKPAPAAALATPATSSSNAAAPSSRYPADYLQPNSAPPPGDPPSGSAPPGYPTAGNTPPGYPSPGSAPPGYPPPGYPPVPGYGWYSQAPAPAPFVDAGEHLHNGFFLRLGLGGGRFRFSTRGTVGGVSDNGTLGSQGVALDISVGGAILPGLIFAAILSGGFEEDPPVSNASGKNTLSGSTMNVYLIGGLVDFYPNPREGLHFGGALGSAEVSLTDLNGRDSVNNPSGFFVAVHGGYEWWVSPEWSLGVLARVAYSKMSKTVNDTILGVNGTAEARGLLPMVLFSATYN